MRLREVLALGLAAGASGVVAARAEPVADLRTPAVLSGSPRQGGVVFGRTRPGAQVTLDGVAVTAAGATGLFVIGFDRDAPAACVLAVQHPDGWRARTLAVAPATYEVQRIDGLPAQMVTPTDPQIIAREARDREVKTRAFASRAATEDFADGFAPPIDRPVRTSPFGVQRVLNGEPKAPHYGVDLAAPEGTPIRAPARGLVVLAEPDLYLDGGLTLIDHGQGLISCYLHQSRLDVAAGAVVARGQVIGAVGMKGRATGPHLCWRLKWRDRNLDPSLLVGMDAPAPGPVVRPS